ncbi:MAG: hypothetical protein KKB79_00035 [Nanoarchaeota archaeon]|nr:hypothetical protein [Nanoarchaeota archaeon]
MKKVLVGGVLVTIMLLAAGLFASAQSNSTEVNNTISDVVLDSLDITDTGEGDVTDDPSADLADKSDEEISDWVYDYIYGFIEKMDITPDEVVSISLVDFDNLPASVNLGSISDGSGLAIYGVTFDKGDGEKTVYVVTYSLDTVDSQDDVFPTSKRQFLNFGFDGKTQNSVFLLTATNVETSVEKGYVMMRDGSITAMSTNLDVLKGGKNIEIIIYINGKPAGFGNMLSAEKAGVQNDYDVISENTVEFAAGDVVSAYLKIEGDVSLEDVTTLVEITTK